MTTLDGPAKNVLLDLEDLDNALWTNLDDECSEDETAEEVEEETPPRMKKTRRMDS